MREKVSEVIILAQIARKLNVMFRLLVPPIFTFILVIKISIFILIPTLTIIFPVFLIPSGPTIAQKVHSPIG